MSPQITQEVDTNAATNPPRYKGKCFAISGRVAYVTKDGGAYRIDDDSGRQIQVSCHHGQGGREGMASRDPIRDFFSFLLGGVLFSMGAFLFFNQVMVSSVPIGMGLRFGRRFAGGWGGAGSAWGGGWGGGFGMSQGLGGGFGLLLIPLTIGVCLLFALRNQRWGWFLVLASVAALTVGVLQTLIMSFQPTSLWNLLTMFALIGSGGGLMFRSLMAYDDGKERENRDDR